MKNHKIYPAMLLIAGLVATPVSAQGPPRFDRAAGRIVEILVAPDESPVQAAHRSLARWIDKDR